MARAIASVGIYVPATTEEPVVDEAIRRAWVQPERCANKEHRVGSALVGILAVLLA